MIFQEFDQDVVCTHSILISEKGDPSGDGLDWQPRTEGISSVLDMVTKITWIIWIFPLILVVLSAGTLKSQTSTKEKKNHS